LSIWLRRSSRNANLTRAGATAQICERFFTSSVFDLARQRVELIQLAVVQDNEQARRLYASLGFLEYGLEKNALKQDGRYYDDVLMAKDLLGK
jgi:RimJ/RimL family protein N-acetyltransferase